jgi:hypothetical protein
LDDQARIDRLMEAVDRVALEGGSPMVEAEEFAPYLVLAAALKEAMPPVQADPHFESALRARLLAQPGTAWWRRLLAWKSKPRSHEDANRNVGRGFHAPSTSAPARASRPAWRYAFAAAAVVLGGAAVVYQATSPGQSIPMAAQPAPEDTVSTLGQPQAAPAADSEAMLAAAPNGARAGDAGNESQPAPAAAPMAAPAADPMAAPPPGDAPLAMGAALAPQGPATLPALPPLAASHPPIIMGGMGGAPEIDGPAPVRQFFFERAAALPDLGQQVTVYRYRQATPSLEANRIMAANLGFNPAELRPIEGAEGAYVVSESDKGYMVINGPGGAVVYHSDDVSIKLGPQPSPAALPDAQAVEVANRWLAERDLLPPEAGAPEVSLQFPGASVKQVTLRPAEPRNIVTPNPQITVSVDATGVVTDAYLLWPEVESALEYPAGTAESAWELLQAGGAEMRFEGEHNRPDLDLTIRITAAEMGYAITFAPDGQAYLQPVLVFRGQSSGGGETLPFTAWAPAVAGG